MKRWDILAWLLVCLLGLFSCATPSAGSYALDSQSGGIPRSPSRGSESGWPDGGRVDGACFSPTEPGYRVEIRDPVLARTIRRFLRRSPSLRHAEILLTRATTSLNWS